MFRHLLIILAFISGSIMLNAQEPAINYVLQDPIPGNETREYIGRDFVSIIQGYSYTPETGNHLLAKTDPLMIFPPDDGDVTGGATNNDEGGVVGTLQGNLLVSPSGAAVYSIPINVPPGVAGMAPQIGFVYNSHGGNSSLGIGWSISGVSAIIRTGTTLYNNGYIDGVDFDNNDQFMLDGQRLIPINVEKTEFRTEIESFSKIVIKESNTYGPVWFEVHTKDGKILEFGNTDDSRIEAQGRNEVLSWNLNRIIDRSGNYIDYLYQEGNGGISYIKKISYGGNYFTGQLSCYDIVFNYKNRVDPNKLWISGSEIDQLLILTSVEISYLSPVSKINSYQLEYDDGFYSHLKSITISDTENNIFKPSKFVWGDASLDFQLNTTNIQNTTYSSDITMGDFNGDGKTDIVRAYYNNDQSVKVFHHWSVSYSNGDGTTFNEVNMGSLEFPSWEDDFEYFLPGDFNGDGLCDLVMVKVDRNSLNAIFTPHYYFSNGTGFDLGNITFPGSVVDNHYFRVVDMNGNGIQELLLVKEMTSNITHFASYEYTGSII